MSNGDVGVGQICIDRAVFWSKVNAGKQFGLVSVKLSFGCCKFSAPSHAAALAAIFDSIHC